MLLVRYDQEIKKCTVFVMHLIGYFLGCGCGCGSITNQHRPIDSVARATVSNAIFFCYLRIGGGAAIGPVSGASKGPVDKAAYLTY